MELFQKLFKKKINIQDVLASLENFSNDVKSLNNVVDVSSKFFGKNWKFNLEMYINSMPIEDNQKYLPLFFNVLNFEKALNLWISAQQVLKGAKSLSSSMLKDMPEYEEFLPKFGIEGVRLLEKFKEQFNIQNITDENKDSGVDEKNHQAHINDEDVENDEKEENITQPSAPLNNQHILKKVSAQDLEEGVFSKIKGEADAVMENENSNQKDEVKVNIEEDIKSNQKEVDINNIDIKSDKDWDIQNFLRVHNFLSQSREIMSAISLFKNVSLENYHYYGFIIDVIDYLLSQGNKILSSKSDEIISLYFKNGREELISLMDFYKKQRDSEIVMPMDNNIGESEKKDYKVIDE